MRYEVLRVPRGRMRLMLAIVLNDPVMENHERH
jgi:hypothetical protein